jgi:hypothetical protein
LVPTGRTYLLVMDCCWNRKSNGWIADVHCVPGHRRRYGFDVDCLLILTWIDTVLSGRVATAHREPSYSTVANLTRFTNPSNSYGYSGDPILNGVQGGMMYATGICKGCQSVARNKISNKNTKQPFIYAVGPPGRNPNSDSLNAPLRRHIQYGYFTLDMTQTVGLSIPPLGNSSSKATTSQVVDRDMDWTDSGHAFFMLLAVVIVIPIGLFMNKVLLRVNLHMIFMSAALALIFVGFGFGVAISKNYNRVSLTSKYEQLLIRFKECPLQFSTSDSWPDPCPCLFNAMGFGLHFPSQLCQEGVSS